MSTSRMLSLPNEFLKNHNEIRCRYGTVAALCSIADRIASKAVDLCVSHVFCFDCHSTANFASAPQLSPDITYRFLTPSDIRSFAADPANELEVEMADRVEAGRDVCFGVLVGKRLAGYGWCALGSIEAKHTGGIALSFPSHIGFMYKGFTHPDFRGLGLNGTRIALSSVALAERGIRQLICLVDWTNWASVHSCRRGGCRELGLATTFQLAGHRFWFVPNAARQLGLRFGDQAELRAEQVVSNSIAALAD